MKPEQLKRLIDSEKLLNYCQYCKKEGNTIKVEALFDHILELVDKNVATEEDLTYYELGLIYDCGADLVAVAGIDIVLSEWFDLANEPYFDDLMAHVSESYLKNEQGQERHFFSDDSDLEQNIYEEKWHQFTDAIRHTHRFFNPSAKGFLDAVFSMLSVDSGELKPEVVRTITKSQELYRARTVADYQAAKKIEDSPHTELGLAPKDKSSSQRMTPHGISALYCALERETCLSEIRSITGDYVVSGAITPTDQIKLLDLTKLELIEPPKLTLFDDSFRDSLHLKTFLKSLVKKISKPKGRNDELSYLSTQVVFEYLRMQFGRQVDGLAFPSVQTGEAGTNVVLFPEACGISSKKFLPPDEYEQAMGPDTFAPPDPFKEVEKLAFIASSLRFHRVKAIETKADEYNHIGDLFMSDLVRKQLGLPFG
ncbi:RES domain-containing protein [uncultured Cedecea sp.]|uniref:RES domain-containing protein n=1 Tax=uncultured Cedecea sp. TaxID=988762 RepID=UPI00262A9F3C|nr:RES domain-containing protein [uncultured Cedecea sp.]